MRDAELLAEIERVFREKYGVYAARKVHAQLNREGIRVAGCTVERLMRQKGLQGLRRGRRPRTTIAAASPSPADLVDRRFTADQPNQLWVADMGPATSRTRRDRTCPSFRPRSSISSHSLYRAFGGSGSGRLGRFARRFLR
uniref:IS3 family transposase n=1 Tax=Amycolatopsis bullii TaxID=941987 RepID=UPI003570DBE7